MVNAKFPAKFRHCLATLAAFSLLVVLFYAVPVRAQTFSEYLQGPMQHFKLNPAPGPAPEVIFDNAQHQPVRLGDFRGRVVLLNLWATWCGYCVREMPRLNALQNQLAAAGLVVLPVSVDRQGVDVAANWLEQKGYDGLKAFADPHYHIALAFETTGSLPVSFLIDRSGREVGRFYGEADWMAPEAIALIRAVLRGDGGRRG